GAAAGGRNGKGATYELIVIGSGPAGEKGAAKAAYFGKKGALVEQAPNYGGAGANSGVPTKAMREAALYVSGFYKRDLHGLNLAYARTETIDLFMRPGRQALGQWIGANSSGAEATRGRRHPHRNRLHASPPVHDPVRWAGRVRLGHDPAHGAAPPIAGDRGRRHHWL